MTLEALEVISPAERRERLLPLESLLQSWPRLTLEPPLRRSSGRGEGDISRFGKWQHRRLRRGREVPGHGQVDANGTLQPKRLLVLS